MADIDIDLKIIKHCRECGVELFDGDNWVKSYNSGYICKICRNKINSARICKGYNQTWNVFFRTKSQTFSSVSKWQQNNLTKEEIEDLGKTTSLEMMAQYISQDYKDVFNNQYMNKFDISPDHYVPKSKYGTNSIENCMLINTGFNGLKNNRDMLEAVKLICSVYTTDETEIKKILSEITERYYKSKDVYSKVYRIISGYSDEKIELTLTDRIPLIDLLNT